MYWFCKTCCSSFYDALFLAKGVIPIAKTKKKKSGKKKGAGSKMSGTKTGK